MINVSRAESIQHISNPEGGCLGQGFHRIGRVLSGAVEAIANKVSSIFQVLIQLCSLKAATSGSASDGFGVEEAAEMRLFSRAVSGIEEEVFSSGGEVLQPVPVVEEKWVKGVFKAQSDWLKNEFHFSIEEALLEALSSSSALDPEEVNRFMLAAKTSFEAAAQSRFDAARQSWITFGKACVWIALGKQDLPFEAVVAGEVQSVIPLAVLEDVMSADRTKKYGLPVHRDGADTKLNLVLRGTRFGYDAMPQLMKQGTHSHEDYLEFYKINA